MSYDPRRLDGPLQGSVSFPSQDGVPSAPDGLGPNVPSGILSSGLPSLDVWQDGYNIAREEAFYEDRSDCPYFQRGFGGDPDGTCSYGCREEPECMTCHPWGGWPGERLQVQAADAARRDLHSKLSEVIASIRSPSDPMEFSDGAVIVCDMIEARLAAFVAQETRDREPF